MEVIRLMKSALMALLGLALILVTAAHAGGRPLYATLSGTDGIPAGDPDGSGEAVFALNPGQQQICYQLSVTDIASATAAHIHEGPAGVNGPPVVMLQAPSNGFASGCISVDRDLIRIIIQNPEGYYVNVHNAEFPPGALRGQLTH